MSEAELFVELTNLIEIDPFALIGVPVGADEKRIAKRYRTIAKRLHPDVLANTLDQQGITPAEATKVIARIVNPSYQKLKQEKSRQEILTMLRLRMRRLARSEKLTPTFEHAKQLASVEENSINAYYEQAISQLAQRQFTALSIFRTCSLEIGQLNLIYLNRKATDTTSQQPTSPIASTLSPAPADADRTANSTGPISIAKLNRGKGNNIEPPPNSAIDYVARHTARAKTYLKQRSYDHAVLELREALKLSPQSSEIHSMLGQTYYKQSLTGMARAHFKQAYRLNPHHRVVKKYIELLGLTAELETELAQRTAQRTPQRTTQPETLQKAKEETREETEEKATNSDTSSSPDTVSKNAWLGKLLGR